MPSSRERQETEEDKAKAEIKLQLAVIECKTSTKPNYSQIAKRIGRAKSDLSSRLKGGKSASQAQGKQQLLSGKPEILFLRLLQVAGVEYRKLEVGEIREFAEDTLNAFGENKHVGKNWPYNLIKKYPWSILLLEKPPEKSPIFSISLVEIEAFFQRYNDAITRYNVDATNIWNVDETGLFIHHIDKQEENSEEKVRLQSGNKKEVTTVVEAISAVGEKINYPRDLFKGQSHGRRLRGTNDNLDWAYAISYEEWISTGYFQQWVRKVFIPNTAPKNPKEYRILIMDNHAALYDEELKQSLEEARVIPIYLPTNCSYFMQPLDVGVFKSSKDHYRDLVGNYCETANAQVVPKDKFIQFWTSSREQAMTKETILNAFEKAGLWPIDKQRVFEIPQRTNKAPVAFNKETLQYDFLNSNLSDRNRDLLIEHAQLQRENEELRARLEELENNETESESGELSRNDHNEKISSILPPSKKFKVQ
ncbi:hypothetical protein I9W82_001163 [Candida metapsilosis]|uniref:DDE-1 domain-containing protein n=1 Tax=Candida metapsilosis TaxID=273372 RepID=A0A8H7ZKZ1_9ASCO|nr:hypothetical protein I9W82_001163 [Candida metapsilosis]